MLGHTAPSGRVVVGVPCHSTLLILRLLDARGLHGARPPFFDAQGLHGARPPFFDAQGLHGARPPFFDAQGLHGARPPIASWEQRCCVAARRSVALVLEQKVLDAPRLWWPVGAGEQHLYSLDILAHVSLVRGLYVCGCVWEGRVVGALLLCLT
jgi:hypothetical protein